MVALSASLLVALALGEATAHAAGTTLPNGFEVRTLASGLDQPLAVAWAPSGRMFIATKPGIVYYLDPGDSSPQQLLDISSHVNRFADRGLIGMAVDSDFASNHFLWLLYVYEPNSNDQNDSSSRTSRLVRVTVNDNGTTSGETVVLGSVVTSPCPAPDNANDCIPADASHVVGTVRSAPDGTLWLGSGDGSDFQVVDPNSLRSYDEQSFAGKIIHVDRDGHGVPGHPFCPPGQGQADDLTRVCSKLYAKGFRNPFRFTLRSGGGPIVGDVGWNTREELDFISPGGNYGWPCYEGGAGTPYGDRTPGWSDDSHCSGTGGIYSLEGTSLAPLPPVYDYLHDGRFTSIVGGPLFPGGGGYPAQYAGKVFISDYSRGTISTYDPASGTAQPFASGPKAVDLEIAPDGHLVFADVANGNVGEVDYAPDALAPVAVADASPRGGDVSLEVHFDSSGSHDPNGGSLTYHWDFDDGDVSDEANPTHTYVSARTATVWLTVTNGAGRSASAPVIVAPGDHAPSAHIDSPADGSTYLDGGSVHVTGGASDPDPGLAPHLDWQVLLHDSGGAHVIGEWFDTTAFDWQTLPDRGPDSYYEIRLTATDPQGLTDTTSVAIHAQTVPVSLDSSPPGAALTYGALQVAAPYQALATVGLHTSVSAVESFARDGATWVFERWSDGGARLHDVVVGQSPLALTAIYDAAPGGVLASASGTIGAATRAVTRRCLKASRRHHHRRVKAASSSCGKHVTRRRASHHRRHR